MVLIGLVLIAIAAGFTADVFVQNAGSVQVDVLGRTFAGGPGWLIVAGALVLIIFVLGARLVAVGISTARRRRVLLREAELVSAASARIRSRAEADAAPTSVTTAQRDQRLQLE